MVWWTDDMSINKIKTQKFGMMRWVWLLLWISLCSNGVKSEIFEDETNTCQYYNRTRSKCYKIEMKAQSENAIEHGMATQRCLLKGGSLVKIDNDALQGVLAKEVRRTENFRGAWIGAKRQPTPWRWVEGSGDIVNRFTVDGNGVIMPSNMPLLKDYVIVMVQTCNNAHIGLWESYDVKGSTYFEVILNGNVSANETGRNAIVRHQAGKTKVLHFLKQTGATECKVFKKYMISWRQDIIRVSVLSDVTSLDRNTFLNWTSTSKLNFRTLSFKQCCNTRGQYEVLSVGETHQKVNISAGGYTWIENKVDLRSHDYVLLETDTVHGLSIGLKEGEAAMYEVTFSNVDQSTRIDIKKGNGIDAGTDTKKSASVGIISVPGKLWMSWRGGLIVIGKGDIAGEQKSILVSWQDKPEEKETGWFIINPSTLGFKVCCGATKAQIRIVTKGQKFMQDQGCIDILSGDTKSPVTDRRNSALWCSRYCRNRNYYLAVAQSASTCSCSNTTDLLNKPLTFGCDRNCPDENEKGTSCGSNTDSEKANLFVANGAYSAWHFGHPADENSKCAIFDANEGFSWIEKQCGTNSGEPPIGIICQTSINNAPEGSVCFGHIKCFKYYPEQARKKRTWFQARMFCRSQKGDLPTISNEMENKEIEKMLKKDQGRVWLGAIRSQWLWEDGTELDYTKWGEGQPSILQNYADGFCASIVKDATDSVFWKAEVCSRTVNHHFICEYDVVPRTTTPDSITTTVEDRIATTSSPFDNTTLPINTTITTEMPWELFAPGYNRLEGTCPKMASHIPCDTVPNICVGVTNIKTCAVQCTKMDFCTSFTYTENDHCVLRFHFCEEHKGTEKFFYEPSFAGYDAMPGDCNATAALKTANVNSIDQCAAHCNVNEKCAGFSFAPCILRRAKCDRLTPSRYRRFYAKKQFNDTFTEPPVVTVTTSGINVTSTTDLPSSSVVLDLTTLEVLNLSSTVQPEATTDEFPRLNVTTMVTATPLDANESSPVFTTIETGLSTDIASSTSVPRTSTIIIPPTPSSSTSLSTLPTPSSTTTSTTASTTTPSTTTSSTVTPTTSPIVIIESTTTTQSTAKPSTTTSTASSTTTSGTRPTPTTTSTPRPTTTTTVSTTSTSPSPATPSPSPSPTPSTGIPPTPPVSPTTHTKPPTPSSTTSTTSPPITTTTVITEPTTRPTPVISIPTTTTSSTTSPMSSPVETTTSTRRDEITTPLYPEKDATGGLTTAALVVVIVASVIVVFILLAILIVVCIMWRRNQRKKHQQPPPNLNDLGTLTARGNSAYLSRQEEMVGGSFNDLYSRQSNSDNLSVLTNTYGYPPTKYGLINGAVDYDTVGSDYDSVARSSDISTFKKRRKPLLINFDADGQEIGVNASSTTIYPGTGSGSVYPQRSSSRSDSIYSGSHVYEELPSPSQKDIGRRYFGMDHSGAGYDNPNFESSYNGSVSDRSMGPMLFENDSLSQYSGGGYYKHYDFVPMTDFDPRPISQMSTFRKKKDLPLQEEWYHPFSEREPPAGAEDDGYMTPNMTPRSSIQSDTTLKIDLESETSSQSTMTGGLRSPSLDDTGDVQL